MRTGSEAASLSSDDSRYDIERRQNSGEGFVQNSIVVSAREVSEKSEGDMGNGESLWRRIQTKFQRRPEVRVLMIGLNGAGKTTILYRLKNGETMYTIPTVGFNVETISYRGVHFMTWDVSGKSKYLWRYYYPNMDVLIFVVDSNDRERMEEVKTELSRLVREDELKDCCLLVMANKQDLPNAMSVQELSTNLDLSKLPCSWYIQDCCATRGDGLLEGLGWVKKQLRSPKQTNRGSPQMPPGDGGEAEPKEHKERSRLQSSWLSFSNYLTRGGGANSTETYQRF